MPPVAGAGSGFLEREFICIKVLGFALLILSHFSLISHENERRPDYFIFIGYFKTGGGSEPPLDPPLRCQT